MPRLYRNRIGLACSLAIFAAGCGDATQSKPLSAKKSNTLKLVAKNARAVTEASDMAAGDSPVEKGQPTEAELAEAAYEAPFPDRLNLFEPLKVAARAASQSREDSTESVVLMGFANLGEPQALLAINGIVRPLSGGQEAAGVRVIEIAPPRAVLQRGRSRWTASIE